MMKTEHWSTPFIRIGNQAVREAQERNRQCGIPNWYSLNGRVVSDSPQRQTPPVSAKPEALHAV